MEKSIENKVVVITGGAAGLGLEMANKFVEKGAKITILLDINEHQGAKAVKELTEKYGSDRVVFFKCDVTIDLEDILEKIINKYKRIDVLINNPGIVNEKLIRKTIDVNITAVMEGSAKFYDYARKDRGGNGGTIINVSSIYGFRVHPFVPSYHASKFAVIGFSKSLGHDYNYKKTGVRVLVLCPGATQTKLAGQFHVRDDESIPDLMTHLETYEWQDVEAIGRGTIELFENADSGAVWVVEGSRSSMLVE